MPLGGPRSEQIVAAGGCPIGSHPSNFTPMRSPLRQTTTARPGPGLCEVETVRNPDADWHLELRARLREIADDAIDHERTIGKRNLSRLQRTLTSAVTAFGHARKRKRGLHSSCPASLPAQHPEIMLGVLIAVLGFYRIAIPGRFARECEEVVVSCLRIAGGYILPPRPALPRPLRTLRSGRSGRGRDPCICSISANQELPRASIYEISASREGGARLAVRGSLLEHFRHPHRRWTS